MTSVPGLHQLIVEGRAAFGGFWPREEPWLGASKVLRSVFCCEHELHKLTIFVQIPAEHKLLLPSIRQENEALRARLI